MSWLRALLLAWVAAVVLIPGAARAHESRPAVLEIREAQGGAVTTTWRVAKSVPDFNMPTPVVPTGCDAVGHPQHLDQPQAHVRRQRYACGVALAGGDVGLQYPVVNPSVATLVRVRLASGAEHSQLLTPGEPAWTIPEDETTSAVAGQYTMLGIRHILEGFDHLLFLACLLLIAGTGRRILITVTGFTVAHSVTLVASAMGWLVVPVPPVEAAIALSIVLLAVEIVAEQRRRGGGAAWSWTYRYPVAVSTSFGLLHGFGFAAVLADIGLPQTEVTTGLLFFNVGVELGQLLFIAAVVVTVRLGLRIHRAGGGTVAPRAVSRASVGIAYAVGSLAAFWLVERVVGFWG